MVNKVYLERSGWTIVAYSDSPAITTYKLKESKQTDSSINDLWTQNIKGNQYILDHKDWEFEIEMTINPMRSQDIKPWQIVRTQNANVNYDGLEIVKIDKNESSFTLFFQKIQTLWETIKNIV
jgi:phage terminase large subunit-like protein